jgi:hypothetical protein
MSFADFASRIFPDLDPQVVYRANPSAPKLPKDVSELLDLVAAGTGVPKDWLAKSARLVLDGLAGCRCLWYLHGCEGTIQAPPEPPHQSVSAWLHKLEEDEKARLMEKSRAAWFDIIVHADWNAGVVRELYFADESSRVAHTPTKVRETKLGKWLKRVGAPSDVLRDFETRAMPGWQWKISTHPFDVLTMSFNRPWTSCMAPGGAAELGPLTDMAAGSAIMFFYRPGAAKPCGRRILRPVSIYEEDFGIADGGRTYGSGPDHLGDQAKLMDMLAAASGHSVRVYGALPLCSYGHDGEALTRYIYSDTDRTYCQQTDEQYAEAYARLLDAPWPPPALDLGDVYDRASGLRELVEHKAHEEFDWTEVTRWETERALGGIDLVPMLQMSTALTGDLKVYRRVEDRVMKRAVEAGATGEYGPEAFEQDVWRVFSEVFHECLDRVIANTPLLVIYYVHEDSPDLNSEEEKEDVVLQPPDSRQYDGALDWDYQWIEHWVDSWEKRLPPLVLDSAALTQAVHEAGYDPDEFDHFDVRAVIIAATDRSYVPTMVQNALAVVELPPGTFDFGYLW